MAGTDDASTGDGKSTAATLDYLLNLPADHLLAEKINRDQIGLAGYSQGGAGALRAATQFSNAGLYKAIFTGSAAYPLLATNMGWFYGLTKLRAPIFMTAGIGNDDRQVADTSKEFAGVAPLSELIKMYEAVPDSVMKVRARVSQANHEDMQVWTDDYMTAWYFENYPR